MRGCVSQVWLVSQRSSSSGSNPSPHGATNTGPRLHFLGTSDAAIVQGLIAILFSLYQDKTAEEILSIRANDELATLGLAEHLTPQRSNGLASMIQRIQADAEALRVAT